MSSPTRARVLAAAAAAVVAAGCQDYNFNPVGHCLLQPGSQRFTLSNVSSADVLFVVDDSGSMAGEQDRLAEAFGDFVANLTSTNFARAQGGLLPLDFHVAVTSSSVFTNGVPLGTAQTCLPNCGAAGAQLACCIGSTTPVYGPRSCTTAGSTGPGSQCPVAGTACRNTCEGFKGELMCCGASGAFPADSVNQVGGAILRCAREGARCGTLQTHYPADACTAFDGTRGVAIPELPYPDGDFVGSTRVSPAVANPRVLHFDKRLYLSSAGRNAQGFDRATLERFFQQNVRVGTCGSPQEQGLAASRRAIEKALAGKQLDTYAYDWAAGLVSTSGAAVAPSFSAPDGIPALTQRAVWPTPNSKLVVVYVGDEDDCSSPKDRSAGVLLDGRPPGNDACTSDVNDPEPFGKKQAAVSSFVDYLTGLGRPLGVAFVVSARSSDDDSDCRNDACLAAACCDRACSGDVNVCRTDVCGGQAAGTRFVEASQQLKAKGADVVVGSVCGDFRPLLRDVAEIVKPPQTLSLPTLPADGRIAILRIASSSGETRKICGRPLVPTRPANYTRTEAEATGADWWFTAAGDPGPPFDPSPASTEAAVAAPSKFVYINPKGACIANPGETYSADYLGVVPAGGCAAMAGDAVDHDSNPLTPARVIGSADCKDKLGGQFSDWECLVPPGLTLGTCTCRSGS